MKLKLELTETIPEDIEEGILYVSFKYWTTAHKCGCGCGQKVVLRLSPKHWAITLNGESVSMYPSVGNWQLPCRSHYWIEEGQILHARRWSDSEIMRNRAMTKGRRTPFQTAHSRLNAPSQFDHSPDLSTGQYSPNSGNNTGENFGEIGRRTIVSTGRDEVSTKSSSTRWWNRVKNSVQIAWRKVIDRIGDSRVS